MRELIAITGGFGIAWLFWKGLEPTYRAAQREGGNSGLHRKLIIIWSTFGVFVIGMFMAARVLLWLG